MARRVVPPSSGDGGTGRLRRRTLVLSLLAAAVPGAASGTGTGIAAGTAGSASAGPTAPKPGRSAAELMDAVMWNREPIGGAFRLTDHQGRLRRDTDFRGKFMLVYFGYTTCPDICPTDLQQIGHAMELLGPAAREVVPIFITLDPKRDTAKLLSAYAPVFHPQMVGLTGSETDIARVAAAYRVFSQRVPVSGWLRYTIDHSSFIYLMGPEGQYLGFLPPSTAAERIADVVRSQIDKGR